MEQLNISIHALRVESDFIPPTMSFSVFVFQSTLSEWRATILLNRNLHIMKISIHALRVESDIYTAFGWWSSLLFQSTLSEWRATLEYYNLFPYAWFQSTLSEWRATYPELALEDDNLISIHALRVESDPTKKPDVDNIAISIHALRVESDLLYNSTCLNHY